MGYVYDLMNVLVHCLLCIILFWILNSPGVQTMFNAVLENACSELGARMSAMDSSSRNAGEMLDRLTLTYNRHFPPSLKPTLLLTLSNWYFSAICYSRSIRLTLAWNLLHQDPSSIDYHRAYWDHIGCICTHRLGWLMGSTLLAICVCSRFPSNSCVCICNNLSWDAL